MIFEIQILFALNCSDVLLFVDALVLLDLPPWLEILLLSAAARVAHRGASTTTVHVRAAFRQSHFDQGRFSSEEMRQQSNAESGASCRDPTSLIIGAKGEPLR